MHVVDAIEIRERHSAMLYKMKSLKLAVNERRNQMQTLQEISGAKRLKSARVKPPKYITALQNMVERDLNTLKAEYEQGKRTDAYSSKDIPQLNTLLRDLERHFEQIMQSFYVPADKVSDDRDRSEHAPTEDQSAVASRNRTERDAAGSTSRTSSLFPDIRTNSTVSQDESASVLSESSKVEMPKALVTSSDSHKEIPSVFSVTAEPGSDLARSDTFPRGYSTLNKHALRSQHSGDNKREYTFYKRSNIGYPYKSSFPQLSPQLGSNNRSVVLPSIEGLVPSEDIQKRSPLKRSSSILTKIAREKTWFY